MSDAVLDAWPPPRVGAPRRLTHRTAIVLAAAAGIAALSTGVFAALMPAVSVERPATEVAPRPTWLEIMKPVQIFSLEAPELSKVTLTYTARRREPADGSREDDLAFGTLPGDQPALRLEIFRRGATIGAPSSMTAAIEHQAAAAGFAVSGIGAPGTLPTRFGRFAVADVSLREAGSSAARPCSGFMLVLDKPTLSITGLACGGRDRPMTSESLGCLIDRIDLASAGEDSALIDFFAASEMRRNAACAGMRLGPDGVHAAWLDDKPATTRKSLRHH